MNRRDLLKRTGTLALGLPALRAASLQNSMAQSDVKCLVVIFSGPFCFWAETNEKKYKVMAPLVGTNATLARHQAWTATSENETILNSSACTILPDYELLIPGSDRSPKISGTKAYQYPQDGLAGRNTLFTLSVPNPDEIIGVRPTMVNFKSTRAAAQSGLLAAGLTFVYRDVDVKKIMLTQPTPPKSTTGPHKCPWLNPYRPCFDNDVTLPCATLGIHLSRVDQSQNGHEHANHVWGKMEEMYPWMEKTTISFPGFNPAGCPPGHGKGAIGPGNDCEVPIMMLQGEENLIRQKR
ncbi:MAG TPA: hypothetical protein VGK24_04025 [Candidatus Angelobacter sp.]|jgi:hypothetical protein